MSLQAPERQTWVVSAPTRYAKNADVHLAYQVVGDGPVDVLAFSPGMLPIDAMEEEPALRRFFERLTSFSRLIRFDLRGIGQSDPVGLASPPTLEQWMSDAVAVLDAVNVAQAAVFAPEESSLVALMLAATYPERVRSLVIVNGTASVVADDDYPIGIPRAVLEDFVEVNLEADAVDRGLDFLALAVPTVANDESFRSWWVRAGNRGASPTVARTLLNVLMFTDVRRLLPLVRVPTLVLHRQGNSVYEVAHGRYLAEHIAGAKFVELDGADHLYWVGRTDSMLEEIEEFLTGARGRGRSDRVLATVLLTDIVGSTQRLSETGDQAWRELLDRHDIAVQRQLERFGGRPIKTTGDGVLATFDGPARAIVCARAIRDAAAQIGLEIRAGIHTGEIELRDQDVAGLAVHIAARVQALANPGEVLVSRTVTDLTAGSGICYEARGDYELKGVPGSWQLFAVTEA